MNGNEIAKIDFITTPSARYDASVGAIINIRTKRALAQGLTGKMNGTYSRGDYDRGNAGVNLTYHKEKWTVDGRYTFIRNDNMSTIDNNRLFSLPTGVQAIDERATEFYNYHGHNAKLTLGYALNDRHQITVTSNLIKGRTPNGEMTGVNHFSQGRGSMTDSILMREQDMVTASTTQNYSFNYLGKLDTLGKQVEFITTFTPIKFDNYSQMRHQDMLLPNGELLAELPKIRNENPENGHIMVVQSDWTLPFGSGLKVDAGFKLSSSRNRSQTLQSEWIDGNWQLLPDWTFSNRFHEDILASYAEAQKQFGATMVKAGLRAENTVMGVRETYNRKFFDLFPNTTVQYGFGGRKVMFNYRKAISRPGFSQMTPFRIYLSEFTVVEGNLNLRPMYSHQFTLNGPIVKDLFLEIGYVKENDRTLQLPRQEGEVIFYAPMNMDREEWSANLSYNRQLARWWDINGHARGFQYGFEGILNDDYISDSGYSFNFGVSSSFRLPYRFAVDVSYNYYAPYGYAGWDTWRTNFARFAVKKSFMNNKAQLLLAFNDIFMGQRYRSELSAGNLYMYNVNYNDTQRISLGFTFNFGKTTVKEAESKKLGNEDVINRAN